MPTEPIPADERISRLCAAYRADPQLIAEIMAERTPIPDAVTDGEDYSDLDAQKIATIVDKDAALLRMAKVNRDQGNQCIRMQELLEETREQISELKAENKELATENADNEYYVQRGLEYDEATEGLEEAHQKIKELENKLRASQRAALEARYTVAPKDLKELLGLAYEAGMHLPNWPEGWATGRTKWRDAARMQLSDAFGKLGWSLGLEAEEAHW